MTILFSYDGSADADAAIQAASRLVGQRDASAVVLAVWEPLLVQALRSERFGSMTLAVPTDVGADDGRSADAARRLAEHGAGVAREAGFDAQARWVADSRTIASTVIESADELDADLIVMGSRGLTGISAFLGSVSNHVLQHTHRPVLIVPAASEARAPEATPAGAARTRAGE
jgi:nucleotide-binding universal stress UspA family protein